MPKMICPRCDHNWMYTGTNKFGCQCPHCRIYIRFDKYFPPCKTELSARDRAYFSGISDEELEIYIHACRSEREWRMSNPNYKYTPTLSVAEIANRAIERVRNEMRSDET